jgi:hypothetical protein
MLCRAGAKRRHAAGMNVLMHVPSSQEAQWHVNEETCVRMAPGA